jgi:hypothetical protein
MPRIYRVNQNSLEALAAQHRKEMAIKKAIGERYEFTRSRRDRVRRSVVYELAADVLEVVPSGPLARLVMRLVRSMGGVITNAGGPGWFAKVRERSRELVPGQGVSAAEMRRAWYRRLADEGMDVEREGGALKELPHWREYRREIQVAVFEKMQEDYWRRRRELDVWGMFAVDGLSVREIEAKTGFTRWKVHDIVTRFRKEIGPVDEGDASE